MSDQTQLALFSINIDKKICQKCKSQLDITKFYHDSKRKDRLNPWCIECCRSYKNYYQKTRWPVVHKIYYEKNKEKILQSNKIHRQKNFEYRKKQAEEYRNNHRDKLLKSYKKHSLKKNNLYESYAQKLTVDDCPTRDENDILLVRCTYCGIMFYPSISEIKCRIGALNGRIKGELRLYCSKNCKKACPTHKKRTITPGLKQATSREVQPQLRQLVFERDNYKCVKCGTGIEESELHCHHIDPVIMNPIESADINNCITFCKKHHIEIHKESWCKTRC